MPDPETLAQEFQIILDEWLGRDMLKRIDELNAAEPDPSICHSHDFCDPNQAMIDALGRFNVEFSAQDDAQYDLINRAWDIAKTKGFGS